MGSLGIVSRELSVYQKFLEDVRFTGERYEVCLPWKEDHSTLPDNFYLSKCRLKSLLQRLRSKMPILEEYDKVIRDQEARGMVENVSADDTDIGKIHYLPHLEVIREDKQTTRLRVAFDASSKTIGPSLNECLYAGPSLSPLLVDIMLRFRIFRVALVGDLEKAFLNVSVHPDDRNVLRFLWVSGVHSDSPEIVVKRFTRLVFGVSPSPFLLNGTLEHHVKKYQDVDPEFLQRFLSGLYVDDLSSGDESVDKSFQLYMKSKFRMLEAGFNMRKWSSNSPELMEMIKECEHKDQTQVQLTPAIIQEDTTYASNTLGPKHEINEDEEHKVLRITWNHKTDELIMCFDKIVEMAETLPLTKTTMLKIIATVYGPLGWVSPIVIPMKVVFQALCRCKQQWDAPLEADLKRKFENWLMELRTVMCIRLNRYYLKEAKGTVKSLELHGNRDASNSAYAAAVYLKTESEGNTETLLVG